MESNQIYLKLKHFLFDGNNKKSCSSTHLEKLEKLSKNIQNRFDENQLEILFEVVAIYSLELDIKSSLLIDLRKESKKEIDRLSRKKQNEKTVAEYFIFNLTSTYYEKWNDKRKYHLRKMKNQKIINSLRVKKLKKLSLEDALYKVMKDCAVSDNPICFNVEYIKQLVQDSKTQQGQSTEEFGKLMDRFKKWKQKYYQS